MQLHTLDYRTSVDGLALVVVVLVVVIVVAVQPP